MSKKTDTKAKSKRKPPFSDPEFQRKAIEKAAITPKPKTYFSKKKRVEKVKEGIIKEELIKSGFVQQIGQYMPIINAALIASASNPRFQSAADRKIVYSAFGILGKEEQGAAQTIGEVLAALMKKK